jgi:hypothetical protein
MSTSEASNVPIEIAQIVVATLEAYVVIGMGFALMFLPRAVVRLDPRIAGAPKTLRLLIFPGVVALWPLVAWRWSSGAHEPIEDNPHRMKARESAAVPRRSKEVAQ